jgi:hypothetical protein
MSSPTLSELIADIERFQAKQRPLTPPPLPLRPKKYPSRIQRCALTVDTNFASDGSRPKRPRLMVNTNIPRTDSVQSTPIFVRYTAAGSPRLYAAAVGLAPDLRQYAGPFRSEVWISTDDLQLDMQSIEPLPSPMSPEEPEVEKEPEMQPGKEKERPPPPPTFAIERKPVASDTRIAAPAASVPPLAHSSRPSQSTPNLPTFQRWDSINSIQKTPQKCYSPPTVHFSRTPSEHNPKKLHRKPTRYVRRTPSLEKHLFELSSDKAPSKSRSSIFLRTTSNESAYKGPIISPARAGYVEPALHPELHIPLTPGPKLEPEPALTHGARPLCTPLQNTSITHPPVLQPRMNLHVRNADLDTDLVKPQQPQPQPYGQDNNIVSPFLAALQPPTPLLPSPADRDAVTTVANIMTTNDAVDVEKAQEKERAKKGVGLLGRLRGRGRTPIAKLARKRFGVE